MEGTEKIGNQTPGFMNESIDVEDTQNDQWEPTEMADLLAKLFPQVFASNVWICHLDFEILVNRQITRDAV